ncbi:MAG TPA: cation transporter [Peptococcaceae bacterium]|nr:cation transporter [Peptococcaceae bacterium]
MFNDGHAHHHAGHTNQKRLLWALGITVAFAVTELVGGLLANSLALLSDAGHMAGDVAALLLSLLALWFAGRPATEAKTFGYHRAEVVAAFVNAAALLVITGFIFYEAYRRFLAPPSVQSELMMGVAVAGLLANAATAWILCGGSRENLNVRGAFLHVLGDLLGSAGAVAAAVIIMLTGWTLADPIISAFIGTLIVTGAWRLLAQSLHVLMEGVPSHLRYRDIAAAILAVPGVLDVHDLHVWSITTGFPALSCHVVIADNFRSSDVLARLQGMLRERFGIDHATLQIERSLVCRAGVCCPPGARAGGRKGAD